MVSVSLVVAIILKIAGRSTRIFAERIRIIITIVITITITITIIRMTMNR